MFFLKPPSSVIGPGENIVIPRGADTVFPELELGIVVGREGKDLSRDQAMEVVFGYTIILDVTARGYGSGERLPARPKLIDGRKELRLMKLYRTRRLNPRVRPMGRASTSPLWKPHRLCARLERRGLH